MTTCPRAWEVEAARDGRLTGKSRQAHDAHVEACAACARDARAFEALALGLRDLAGAERDDVAVRRLRHRLLDAVDAEQTGRTASGRGDRNVHHARARRASLAALVVAAVVIGLVAFGSWRRTAPSRGEAAQAPASTAAPLPRAEASAVADREETEIAVSAAGARYTRVSEADVERFDLVEGTLHLSVRRPAGGRRVLVVVPDGEIEDVGTTFDVVVADRRTERVSVQEGRVVVRLTDRAPVRLDAGNTWRRSRPVKAATASAPGVTQAEREDAAYLEVLRLLHEGHETEARVAASRYLHDFPTGFRRSEMDRIATGLRPR